MIHENLKQNIDLLNMETMSLTQRQKIEELYDEDMSYSRVIEESEKLFQNRLFDIKVMVMYYIPSVLQVHGIITLPDIFNSLENILTLNKDNLRDSDEKSDEFTCSMLFFIQEMNELLENDQWFEKQKQQSIPPNFFHTLVSAYDDLFDKIDKNIILPEFVVENLQQDWQKSVRGNRALLEFLTPDFIEQTKDASVFIAELNRNLNAKNILDVDRKNLIENIQSDGCLVALYDNMKENSNLDITKYQRQINRIYLEDSDGTFIKNPTIEKNAILFLNHLIKTNSHLQRYQFLENLDSQPVDEEEKEQQIQKEQFTSATSQQIVLDKTHNFCHLQKRLHTFEEMMKNNQYLKAVVVFEDIEADIKVLAKYFPQLFSNFYTSLVENIEKILAHKEKIKRHQEKYEYLKESYHVDIEAFKRISLKYSDD